MANLTMDKTTGDTVAIIAIVAGIVIVKVVRARAK